MTYPETPCVMLAFAGRARVGLRRYTSSDVNAERPCPLTGWHGAIAYLGDVEMTPVDLADRPDHWKTSPDGTPAVPDFAWPPDDDPAWPCHCQCGYEFTDADPRQHWWETLYRPAAGGELVTLRDAPPGSMWDAWWYPWKGPDGRSLVVKCPNGLDWTIDSRATNCTLPDDHEHRCWVRHGEPPAITVDKNGHTCSAGAGSIQAGDYHGYLRAGVLTAG